MGILMVIGFKTAMKNPSVGFFSVGFFAAMIFGALGALALRSGLNARLAGKKLRSVDAQAVLARDPRPLILYLRSFIDDGQDILIMPTEYTNAVTYEQNLVHALRPLGPVVAIGKPGEWLPTLGAARMYVDDDHWQQTVTDLMTQAGVVLFRGGQSEGLKWELKEAVRCVPPQRLVIFWPYTNLDRRYGHTREELYAYFRDELNDIFIHKFPEHIHESWFIYFHSDWTAHLVKPAAKPAFTPIKDFVSLRSIILKLLRHKRQDHDIPFEARILSRLGRWRSMRSKPTSQLYIMFMVIVVLLVVLAILFVRSG
ncbi:MAG: hypothetical protein ACHRXM_36460 [Isosphaerales bacterium]